MRPSPVVRPSTAVQGARALLGALLLTVAAYGAHELTHHAVAALACGPGGSLSLTRFTVARGCAATPTHVATLAGPAFSFVLAWLAARALGAGHRAALVVVFASFAHLRFLLALRNTGDEALVLRRLAPDAGSGTRVLLAAILLALVLPALVAAWRALDARHRGWRFAGWCVMPIPVLIGMDHLDALVAPWLTRAPAAGSVALTVASAALGWLLVRSPAEPLASATVAPVVVALRR
jgi:hypothetical protein